MKYLLAFLAVATAAIAGEIKLPSGRTVNVLKVGPMIFTSNLPTAWVLLYETKYPWSAKKEIIAEVDEIWTIFRPDVEQRKMKMGIIKVTRPATGFILENRAEINFVFEPVQGGGWKMQLPNLMKEEKPEAAPPPNPVPPTPSAKDHR